MKYKGSDAPRASYGGTPGALIWNTDYDYGESSGYTVNQTIRQAYPQSLATFRTLAAQAELNGSTEVSMRYEPGGYCTLTQRNRSTGVDANGNGIYDINSEISETWTIGGVDEQIDVWRFEKTVALLANMQAGVTAGWTARDARNEWRKMVQAWLDGDRTYEVAYSENLSETVYLDETMLIAQFGVLGSIPDVSPYQPQIQNLLSALTDGQYSVGQANYVIEANIQVPILYSKVADLYGGVDQYWSNPQLQSLMPSWLVLPSTTGKWLKKAPTQSVRTRTSREFQLRWEQDRNPQAFLYPDYAP